MLIFKLIFHSYGDFKSLKLEIPATISKLSQFDWPFEMEAIRSCQTDVKN